MTRLTSYLIQIFFAGAFIAGLYPLYGREPVRFKHLGINEGLSQNSVFCMIQDYKGFIWIGTEDGLNRYDGYEFTIFKHRTGNKTSLSHSQVNAILEDSQHNLWVGTSDGLNLFNRNSAQFTRFRITSGKLEEPGNYISSLIQDSRGNIWIGTYDGLRLYDRRHEKFLQFNPHNISEPGSNKIKALFEDQNRMLWVSVGNDLRRFDPDRKVFMPLPAALEEKRKLRTSSVRAIRQDKKGCFWFGTETSGLFRYDPLTKTCTNYRSDGSPNSLLTNVVRDILLVADDQIWIGTRDGLSIFNPRTVHFSNYRYDRYDPSSLSHNSIRSFLRDHAGNIWIGTFAGGINTFNQSSANFAYIGEQVGLRKGLTHSVVSSVLQDDKGALWIGTEGGGLNYIDRKKEIYRYFSVRRDKQNTGSNIVKSLAMDLDGNLWVGTYDGLIFFNKRTGDTQTYSLNKEREAQDKRQEINSILPEKAGVWIGTNGSGLNFLDRHGKISAFLHDPANGNSLSSDNLTDMLKDDQENLWIGTQRGLNYFNRKKHRFVQFFNDPENSRSLSNNSVLSLFYDSKHRLWIGTQGGGLNFYDKITGKFYAITEKEGLANNVVHAIREDDRGNLWVSTNKGLSRIRIRKFTLPFEQAGLSILNYTVDDGLQSNQFSPRAAAKGQNGELFFGGINGISSFFPDKLIRNAVKPEIVFTEFRIKNKPVSVLSENSPLKKPIDEAQKVTLRYDQAFISIRFAALNYVNPEKNQYAYKLEGFSNDNDWHYIDNQRVATYTNLGTGNYIFKVKAANNDRVWNNIPRTLYIKVLPPPWKTWWAYLIYTVIILVLLYLFYYYSYKTAKLKNELLIEHMLHEKDQELAQRKMSFFTNISHEIKTPLTLILAPIEKLISSSEGNNKVQNQLMLMQRNGERLIRLINQLLDFRKFESGNMKLHAAGGNIVKFVNEVCMAFEAYAINRKIDLKFSSEKKQIHAWFDRDKLEKILYNLLSNAMKFTPEGGRIRVRLKCGDHAGKDFMYIEVEDNGIGIASENRERIFEQFHHHPDNALNSTGSGIGLAFTKGLVELHHGEIKVISYPAENGKGYTCFTVMLPLGKEHLSGDEMITDFVDSEHISFYHSEPVPDEENLQRPVRRPDEEGLKEKPVMLVVEDNVDVCAFIASSFDEDFSIYTASDGLQGWEKATEIVPDIIISDVMMPQMSGTVLCSKLKADARTSHIPVILLTARTPLIFKIEGLETGADDYITKPFSIRLLEARVWNLLDSRKKLRERFRKEIYLQPDNIAITSPDEKFLEKVMNFIERNMEESCLSVEELGKEAGMSRVTLYRKIKALTGLTAIEFIRNIRLKRAAQLLEQDKLHVSEVAYLVGFTDIDYFRKCFKEQFGYTPKEYAGSVNNKAGSRMESV